MPPFRVIKSVVFPTQDDGKGWTVIVERDGDALSICLHYNEKITPTHVSILTWEEWKTAIQNLEN